MLVPLCYIFLYLWGVFSITCQSKSVPNVYVFGDSIVDSGPKSYHATGLKTGYLPYGTQCLFMDKSRFTDGHTIPEYISSALNVFTPRSMDDLNIHAEHGINYASASSGILPETGTTLGINYCLEKQVNFFNETVDKTLRPRLQEKLSEYLADSIYIINIGTSDYIYNYLQPDHYNSSRKYSGEDYAELLTNTLGNNLKDLYNIGARKMLVFQVGPLGCYPYVINKVKPSSRCAEDVNSLVSIFNEKLDVKLKELSEKLDGSAFVTARIFDLIKSMILRPSDYGFAEMRWPCCVTQENGTGLCKRDQEDNLPPDLPKESIQRGTQRLFLCMEVPPIRLNPNQSQIGKPVKYVCQERDYYLFFDELHMTQAAYKFIVNKCLNSTSSDGACSPYGIYQLAEI
ncbi:hypothetical protein RHSIM_Rhsim09G0121300 [Rhododendron simsii]|uniref:Uncharacterized protein n=1 Tax=Rhododendron simsii TaxID=118357 RepID=A0A834GIS7_RHOSS|nr:hypothetical protein RHSIM_Rhsim09G0121300 [Rhododendron simsii]